MSDDVELSAAPLKRSYQWNSAEPRASKYSVTMVKPGEPPTLIEFDSVVTHLDGSFSFVGQIEFGREGIIQKVRTPPGASDECRAFVERQVDPADVSADPDERPPEPSIIDFLNARLDEDEAAARTPAFLRRFTPARMLADIAAKRAVMRTAGVVYDIIDGEWGHSGMDNEGRILLNQLAAPYADHADYQQIWRIEG